MRKTTFNIVPFSVSKVPVTPKYGFEENVGFVKDTFYKGNKKKYLRRNLICDFIFQMEIFQDVGFYDEKYHLFLCSLVPYVLGVKLISFNFRSFKINTFLSPC